MPISLNKDSVVFLEGFKKDLNKLDKQEQKYVLEKLNDILLHPQKQNIKQLISYPLARYRLKLGYFRALFNQDAERGKYIFIALKKRKILY